MGRPSIPQTNKEYEDYISHFWNPYQGNFNIIVSLTDDCPLRCTYCFMNFQKRYMEKETLDLFLERFLGGYYGIQIEAPPTVSFFGGEPMLMFDEIIVPIVEKYGSRCLWSITTNGVLLTPDRLLFMGKHNFLTGVFSIDGAPKTQNLTRPFADGSETSGVLETIIPYCLTIFPNLPFRTTIVPETIDNLEENLKYAISQGFKNYFYTPDEFSDWDEESLEKLRDVAKVSGAYYMDFLTKGEFPPMRISPLDRVLTHLASPHSSELDTYQSPVRCGLGFGGWGLGVDGTVYGCQEKNSQGESIFVIGDISGIDKEKHLKLLQTYALQTEKEDRSKCESCIAKSFCNQVTCPSRQLDLEGVFGTTIERANCVLKQELYLVALFINAFCLACPDLQENYKNFLQGWGGKI